VWRRGSVIVSCLLDLTASALLRDTELSKFLGHMAHSVEGRWTIAAAIHEDAPVPVLSAAHYQHFSSRGEDKVADKVLSAWDSRELRSARCH